MYARTAIVDLTWNRTAIDLFLALTLVPVALAFSVRTFPLYLRLPPIDWPVAKASLVYVGAAVMVVAHRVVPSVDQVGVAWLGHVTKGVVLLYFVWKLDILLRRRPPWTIDRLAEATGGPIQLASGCPIGVNSDGSSGRSM